MDQDDPNTPQDGSPENAQTPADSAPAEAAPAGNAPEEDKKNPRGLGFSSLGLGSKKAVKKSPPPKKGEENPKSEKESGGAESKEEEKEEDTEGEKAPDPAKEMGRLGQVSVRNEFYRDGYRTILKLAFFQSLIIVALIGVMFYVVKIHQPENRYFATTEDGRLIPMIALSEPNLSAPALMSWVAQASTEVMTFGFNDYRRRLQEASRNFTRQGWESFTQALQRSRIIETMEANNQILTAAPRGAPILESEGMYNGRYQWIVQIPMILTYQSGSRTRTDSLLVSIVIVRVPRLESANGVGIEQWIAVPG